MDPLGFAPRTSRLRAGRDSVSPRIRTAATGFAPAISSVTGWHVGLATPRDQVDVRVREPLNRCSTNELVRLEWRTLESNQELPADEAKVRVGFFRPDADGVSRLCTESPGSSDPCSTDWAKTPRQRVVNEQCEDVLSGQLNLRVRPRLVPSDGEGPLTCHLSRFQAPARSCTEVAPVQEEHPS